MLARYFPSDSDRRVQGRQQFRRGSARPLRSAAKPGRPRLIELPEPRRLIDLLALMELLASIERCQAVGPKCRSAKP